MGLPKIAFKNQLHDKLRIVFVIYNPDYGFINNQHELVKAITEAAIFETRDSAYNVLESLQAGVRVRAEVRKVHQSLRLYNAV